MKISTSYYSNWRNFPADSICISIAGKCAAGYTGLEYKKLAPKWSFFNIWKETQELSGGKDIILLCWESSRKFCHRHLVGAWLSADLNIEVVEL